MGEIIFDLTHGPQVAQFTGGRLTSSEYALVKAVVSWDQPQRYASLIHTVYGRSITFASPDRPNETFEQIAQGDFSGLQIMGAGGCMDMVVNGIYDEREKLLVAPVDPSNHAKELYEITGLKRIDESGALVGWHRAYAPLHGMDSKEAEARKYMTGYLRTLLTDPNQSLAVSLVVPELAAEGIFPDKKDIYGDPLHFQVYRVPLIDRFPSQFIKTSLQKDFDQGFNLLVNFSYCAGGALRFKNDQNVGYLDGHLGNMSLASSQDRMILFATDLGSAEDITHSSFKDRYRGFDVYMYFESLGQILTIFGNYLQERSFSEKEVRELNYNLYFNAAANFMEGYFRPELTSGLTAQTTPEEIADRVTTKANQLAKGLIVYSSPQQFIEFFEQYYRRF